MKVAVLHGPNLNLLGRREPEVYGRTTLAEIDARIVALGVELDASVVTFQSNGEGELVGYVQTAEADGFIVNAGGYSHTSVALLDALVGVGRPYVEVHLSNLSAREPFRRQSLLAPRAAGIVMGLGADGYLLALRGLVQLLRRAEGEASRA